MRTDEFVMRGQTASDSEETLNFSGYKPGYAYKMVEFMLYPSTNIGSANVELMGSVTASKTAEDPQNPDYNNEGLIATAYFVDNASNAVPVSEVSVVNHTFLITQNLILKVKDSGGANTAVNWQCKFMPVKMSGPEEAVTNYRQFLISDD